MKKISFSFLFILSLCGCNHSTKANTVKPTVNTFTEIDIIPLGNVDSQTIELVRKGVEAFYGVVPKVKKSQPLTSDLLTKSGRRYNANLILAKYRSERYVLLITEKDIATKYLPRKSDEWGILGLSHCPGHTAVVSTFRMKRNSSKFAIRLQKVCNHELGHSLGLKHCNATSTCLMNDARGTMKQIDKEEMKFCDSCEKTLKKKM
jgi:archaemetzincin